MGSKVLITGGAGFIGSNTASLLIKEGYEVHILDNLDPQVHQRGPHGNIPKEAFFIKGDILDSELVARVLSEVDAVIHLAAAVGVGQSMYQVKHYVDTNTSGTAVLLDQLVNKPNEVKKLIVASSMNIYGEGRYRCHKCGENRYPSSRNEARLRSQNWGISCPECGEEMEPVGTHEESHLNPTSIYAQTKKQQEEICFLIGRTYGIPTAALRYFNVYGPGQSLSNPYTGVCAIFLSKILSGKSPYIFEDGMQSRDFIHVTDVARANLMALQKSSVNHQSINVGTGEPTTILHLAEVLAKLCGFEGRPIVSQNFRKGDVRHCWADTRKAERLLEFRAKTLEDGLVTLVAWAQRNKARVVDHFDKALKELHSKRLIRGSS